MGNGTLGKRINWNSESCRFTGRNGNFSQKGLEIWRINDLDHKIYFTPITSKGKFANCEIQIPKEHLQQLIDNLKTFL